jgi:competence ComEA-like helix-hairpin-helix protein
MITDGAKGRSPSVQICALFNERQQNIASAKDLQDVGGFTPKDAAALIRYRTSHGDFHTFEDLQKVSGLDSAALDKNKARIAFTGQ